MSEEHPVRPPPQAPQGEPIVTVLVILAGAALLFLGFGLLAFGILISDSLDAQAYGTLSLLGAVGVGGIVVIVAALRR